MDLRIVKNCLDSLSEQSSTTFKVILVDYGSTVYFSGKLTIKKFVINAVYKLFFVFLK